MLMFTQGFKLERKLNLSAEGKKTKGKRAFGGLKSRREDNIKMGVKDMGRESVGWIHLAQYKIQ
jgi:hypothetical protein